MYSVPIIPGRRWKSALGSLIAFMLAFVVTTNIATAQRDSSETGDCIEIIEQSIECAETPNGTTGAYEWCFAFRNLSNHNITSIRVGNATQSVGLVQPRGTGRVCITVYGRPGITTVGLLACVADSVYVEDSGRNGGITGRWEIREKCCDQRVELRLPDCEQDTTKGCFEIIEQSIECEENSTNALWYQWCFAFRNQSGHNVTSIQVQGQTVDVGLVQPGGIGRACVRVSGAPGVTTFTVVLCQLDSVFVRDTSRKGGHWEVKRDCCEQRVQIRLPECDGEEGCIDIVEQEIECLPGTAMGNAYEWCFVFINNSNFPVNSIQVGGNTVNVGPVPPGGRGQACVRLFSEPGPTAATIIACFSVRDSNTTGGGRGDTIMNNVRCCTLRVELRLPECDPHEKDCCEGFQIGLANIAPVAAPNGLTGLLGAISAGPNNITKASATIVSSTVNGQPAFGYFNSGIILNPLGAGTVTPPPFGQELIWNAPGGVNMNAPSLTLEWLRFPPMAPNARTDVLEFCIRWRFTDDECRTCDTLVCYRVVRRQSFFLSSQDEKGASIQSNNGFVSGELTGENSATLSITLPELPEGDFGTVTYTGITLQADEGIQISNVNGGNTAFSTEHGLAIATISGQAGDEFNLEITYTNLNNRPALGHFLLLGYESSLMPGIQQQLPLSVTLRQAGTERGGDQVNAVRTEIEGAQVETFALHLKNANNSSEPLAGLRIKAGSGVKLLAVGPTSSDEEALLRFGSASETGRTYISEASEGTMQLAPGAERNPIYLTVSYNGELSPVVHYETLNGLDDVVSEGDVDLTQVSSVRDGGVTGTSISLGQSQPNPATGQASISLRLSEREHVNLTLRDARGQEVASLLDGEVLESGVHVVNVNVTSLANGVYFYTLETATGTETRKLVVQK